MKQPVRKDRRNPPPAGRPPRRPWRTPVLKEFGSVAKLTQTSATGSVLDGKLMMTCL